MTHTDKPFSVYHLSLPLCSPFHCPFGSSINQWLQLGQAVKCPITCAGRSMTLTLMISSSSLQGPFGVIFMCLLICFTLWSFFSGLQLLFTSKFAIYGIGCLFILFSVTHEVALAGSQGYLSLMSNNHPNGAVYSPESPISSCASLTNSCPYFSMQHIVPGAWIAHLH